MNHSSTRFFNRELSWLEFNQRVLDEALDPDVPLLERLRFLAITASNLDEFVRVRVGSLQILVSQSVTKPDPAGLTPAQQLDVVRERIRKMNVDQYACLLNDLEPRLAESGLRRLTANKLSPQQLSLARQLFETEIFPVLSPIAVSSSTNFPLLAQSTLNLCILLKSPDGDKPRFAVLPLGPALNRIINLTADTGNAFILLEDLVILWIDRFFPGETVVEVVPFRITRNADMSLREDQAGDLLAEMQHVLVERKHGNCIRLEVSQAASRVLTQFLRRSLRISRADLFPVPDPLDLSAFFRLADRKGFEQLRYQPWPPQPLVDVPPGESMFRAVSAKDRLLYHPYDSFEPVVQLLEEAADDPDVLAIKQTLYRTARDSRIVAALTLAAEKGKHVTAVVELKARFDEARNIEWAQRLAEAGAHVIYGVKGLKTHAKILIIVRKEARGIQRYVHVGTGNYNEETARIYSDASLITCDPELGADATAFFNAITGYSLPQPFRKLAAAPHGLRDRLLELIRHETERARAKLPARIIAKVNSLVDPQLIEALYDASSAGVKIQLNVRGICCLKPGVRGFSENIQVVSIIDRFLEHARILNFHHGGQELMFISSADWMPRNLDKRIELLIPIEDQSARLRLLEILHAYFQDTVKARWLNPDGAHRRSEAKKSAPEPLRAQHRLYQQTCAAVRDAEQHRRLVFEPHVAPGNPS